MRQVQLTHPEAPTGMMWEEFEYNFDPTNTPILNTQLLPGQTLLNIPLVLQSDAVFFIRAIQVNDPQQSLGVRFRDAFGRYLSSPDTFVPSFTYSSPQPLNGSLPGISVVLIEPPLECPKGSVILLDIANIA